VVGEAVEGAVVGVPGNAALVELWTDGRTDEDEEEEVDEEAVVCPPSG